MTDETKQNTLNMEEISEEDMNMAALAVCDVLVGRTLFPSDFNKLSVEDVLRLMTITQYVTNLGINELERRGELKMCDDCQSPIIPYMSNHAVETILTREQPAH